MIKHLRPLILAIDIGNTSVTMGLVRNQKILRKQSVLTRQFNLKYLSKSTIFKNSRIEAVLVCSVVPAKNHHVKKCVARQINKPNFYIIGKHLPVPIQNLTRRPKEVGIDRLVSALQAYKVFKHKPCVAVDFGTAITFDVVSKKGAYLGGIIAPGVELILNALAEKTALLPYIRLKKPRTLIGKDTTSSIRSGCTYGLAALCDGILDRLNRDPKCPLRVIATGGYAKYIAQYSRYIHRIDENHVLKGMETLYNLVPNHSKKIA